MNDGYPDEGQQPSAEWEAGYRFGLRQGPTSLILDAIEALRAALAAPDPRLAAFRLDEGLLATALEGYEVVPYKPSPNDDYEEHRQGAAKAIAAAYRLAAYRASQERV